MNPGKIKLIRTLLPVSCSWILMLLLTSCNSYDSEIPLPEVVDFNLHIRPILSNNCFVCHGPDISSRKASLRLDLEEMAKSSGDSGKRAIVSGKARRSELYRRISSQDPETMMPPPESNRTLTPHQQALIEKWIDQGAEWKDHWAFIKPVEEEQQYGDSHPIDHFIANNHRAYGLTPAKEASQGTLKRRLSYILTGLPPGKTDPPHDLHDPVQYQSYVDSLLASPQYGERWARHWMDLMRYAEGRGHEFDYPVIGAWHYRDYLIRSFNEDVPYDQMIREHLAGDMLKKPRLAKDGSFNESILGTVSLGMSEGKHSPVDTKEEEKIKIDNMIDVTSKTFLGLTVACARCHDHKFDAIPTTDYYAMYGIFESTRTNLINPYAPVSQKETIDSISKLKEDLKKYLVSQFETSQNATLIAKKSNDSPKVDFTVLGDFRGSTLENWMPNGLAFGHSSTLGDPIINAESGEVSLPSEGVASSRRFRTGISGALRSPTFTIDQDYLLFRAAGRMSSIRVVLDNLQLIQDPIHGELSQKIDHPEQKDYTAYVGMWKGSKAYIEIMPGQYYAKDGKNHHFRLDPESWVEAAYVLALDSLPSQPSNQYMPPYADVNNTPATSIKIDPEIWQGYQKEQERFVAGEIDTIFTTSVVDADDIESPVFIRGDHNNLSQERVPHRFLSALAEFDTLFSPGKGSRLSFAEAIANEDNPLTSRVMVNRIWHHLFGRGIVATVDNFGLQGELPTNLPLLDHLANKFIEFDWSIKKMIRYIVTSNTFKQSTDQTDANKEIDPDNKFLHAFPIRRLEAEAIRDAILATSGRLDLTMYGESIPLHLTEFLGGRGRPKDSGPLDGRGRRSIYQAMWRNFLPPFMLTFDMPIPFSTFGNRSETNVPAQSLTLLNDPFVQEQAKVWAKALYAGFTQDSERILAAYEAAFGRKPSSEELENSLDFLKGQSAQYDDLQNSEKTLQIWTDYCHSLFNMKEFIYLI